MANKHEEVVNSIRNQGNANSQAWLKNRLTDLKFC